MACKVDWISFTVPCSGSFKNDGAEAVNFAINAVNAYLGASGKPIVGGHGWKINKRGGFYHTAIVDIESKFSLSIGDVNSHVYVQCNGQACDYMRDNMIFDQVIERVHIRVSRIDFAVDFETDVQPSDYIVNNQRRTFKSGGHQSSPDGETCYIGSRKSERFARVYRYHAPHPRHHLLRAEAECKGQWAKILAKLVLDQGELIACLSAHEPFEWVHPLWQPDVAVRSLRGSKAYDRGSGSTLRWLTEAVTPSLARLHKEGMIDAFEWFLTTLTPLLK